MCGQCGILAGSIITTEMKAFVLNLKMNVFRGRDSTGVVSVTRPTLIDQGKGKKQRYKPMKASIWKEPRDAWAFFAYNDLDPKSHKKTLFDGGDKRLMMGHCRSATIGEVTAKNAHPFVAGNIIGMHNGTIKKKFKYSDDFETDSEAFFNLINDVGVKDAVAEVDGYSSAYAIQFFDKSTNLFHVVRNADRPLVFVYTKSRGALLWSSEEIDLRYAAKKAGLELEDKSFQPKVNELMTFDLSKTNPHGEYALEDITPKKAYTPYRAPSTPTGGQNDLVGRVRNYQEYQYNADHTRRFCVQTNKWQYLHKGIWHNEWPSALTELNDDIPIGKAETTEALAPEKKFVGPEQVVFIGFQGRNHMKKDFENILMNGCANCGTQPSVEDPDIEYKVGWYNHTEFFCEECCQHPDAQKFLIRHQNKKPETPDEDSPFVETQDVDPNEDT